jgi:hypothetical protein
MGPASVFGLLKPWILKTFGLCLFLNQWNGAELQHTQLIIIPNAIIADNSTYIH